MMTYVYRPIYCVCLFIAATIFHGNKDFHKEIRVPSKIRLLPSGTLLQTLDLENFATAYRSSRHVINLARERWTLRA